MRRPLTPLWLARPSRIADLSRSTACWALALLGLMLLATFTAFTVPPTPAGQGDILLYSTIVEGVRHGGEYYAVAADALRAGGYPLRPFLAFPLPTLAVVEATLPGWAIATMLYALGAAVTAAWAARLAPAFTRRPARMIAVILLLAGMVAFVRPDLAMLHAIWAGLFIALSLAIRRPGRWVEGVAFGLAAALLHETALAYLAIMAAFALLDGRPREAIGWTIAIAVVAGVVAVHAHAVAQVVKPLDMPASLPAGAFGFGMFVKLMVDATALSFLPLWLAAPLVGLALFGWAIWRDPLALRMIVLLTVFALGIGIAGHPDQLDVLLVAPALLVGLAFVADGARDLIGAALDRRRITVRRVVR